MKRQDLIKLFRQNGWRLKRQGHDHEIWEKNSQIEMIPRHSNINERLAKALIHKWGL